jgi:Ca-activated chloride channel family protein
VSRANGRALTRVRRRASSIFVCATAVVAFAAPTQADEAPRTGAAKVSEGNKLLTDGKFKEALAAYDEAREALPESAAVAYNRGIALYRLGEYDKSIKALQDALKPDQPELESKVKYNLGRCAHESALRNKENLEVAINDLTKAISFYKDAIGLNVKDDDAKRNLEQAERLRQFLEKKLKEQQEQKKQNPTSQPTSQPDQRPTSQPDEKQQPSSQPSSQPDPQQVDQGQDQHPQDQKPGDEKQQDHDGQSGDEKEDKKQDQQAGKQDQKRDQKSGRQGSQAGKQEGQDEQNDAQEAQGGEEGEDQKMKPEDAEPMLQEARDAERARREAKREMMMRLRGRVPVKKDW